MYERIIIGVDQSYTRTGISIAADGELLKVSSEAFKGCKNKTEKRLRLISILEKLIPQAATKASNVCIICERIRLVSRGAISIDYIKATGALTASIVDTAYKHGIKAYSVDTRSWKAQVVGTSKSDKGDKGAKQPTIRYICKLGFSESIISRNRYDVEQYDDDAADSACIALYGFVPKSRRKLKLEQ